MCNLFFIIKVIYNKKSLILKIIINEKHTFIFLRIIKINNILLI